MTRGQIKAQARLLINEFRGVPGFEDYLSWDNFITETTDEVARISGAGFYTYTADIVSGQAFYCFPDGLTQIENATVKLSDGTFSVMSPFIPEQYDKRGNTWRISPETGNPTSLIVFGDQKYQLYPIPNYNTAANTGISIDGHGVPGSSWAAQTANCPLRSVGHMAVAYGAAVLRCQQMVARRPELQLQLPHLMREYAKQKGYYESEVATLSIASRHRDDTDFYNYVPSGPLDL